MRLIWSMPTKTSTLSIAFVSSAKRLADSSISQVVLHFRLQGQVPFKFWMIFKNKWRTDTPASQVWIVRVVLHLSSSLSWKRGLLRKTLYFLGPFQFCSKGNSVFDTFPEQLRYAASNFSSSGLFLFVAGRNISHQRDVQWEAAAATCGDHPPSTGPCIHNEADP